MEEPHLYSHLVVHVFIVLAVGVVQIEQAGQVGFEAVLVVQVDGDGEAVVSPLLQRKGGRRGAL